MKKFLILVLTAVFALKAEAQPGNNILLPEHLLVQDIVYLRDSSYASNSYIDYPVVQVFTSEPGADLFSLLIDRVFDKTLNARKPVRDDYFPYSAIDNRDPEKLSINDNGSIISDSANHSHLKKEDLYNQAVGISFLENWNFNPSKFSFNKEVLGFEIVRKYQMYSMDMYDIPFRVVYPAGTCRSKKDYQLIGHVEYEFLLAPVSFYHHIINEDDQIQSGTTGYFDLPVKNYYGNNNRTAPLLVGYGKRKLIEALLDKVTNGDVPAFDYYSGEGLSQGDVNRRICATDTFRVEDSSTGSMKDTVEMRRYDLSDFNSVIFGEDWYVNPSDGHIIKKVKSIALVRGYMKETEKFLESFDPKDMEWTKEIVFRVKLNSD